MHPIHFRMPRWVKGPLSHLKARPSFALTRLMVGWSSNGRGTHLLLAMATCLDCDDGGALDLLQRRGRTLSEPTIPDLPADGGWNFDAYLTNTPRGIWTSFLAVVAEAIALSYITSAPVTADFPEKANATLNWTEGSWDRAFAFDMDPIIGGPIARVFVQNKSQRVVIAFKGGCGDPTLEQCKVDLCYADVRARSWGNVTDIAREIRAAQCSIYSSLLDFTTQADRFVRRVQKAFCGYHILLTGHSLGGMLAMAVAAQQPGILKAFTIGAEPFDYVLTHEMNFTEEQMSAVAKSNDIVLVCDPFDCGLQVAFSPTAYAGVKTCAYLDAPIPEECASFVRPFAATGWQQAAFSLESEYYQHGFNSSRFNETIACDTRAHEWLRYLDPVLKVSYPTCFVSDRDMQGMKVPES